IVVNVSGNQLTLNWPSDHTGWLLQSNSVSLMDTNSWFDISGSDATNKVVITLDPTMTNVFYRLLLP
ncbi:MAG TPA: hypothetical protein VFV81_01280, partial [Verrucomicrobiae bacterium]|nr:hypothetical protein [Verrucomicrobiae bacterium]